MKGWHGESHRHSLAARGIRTRAVLDPRTRKPIDIKPTRIRRYVEKISHLGRMLNKGIVSETGYGCPLASKDRYYGGLTTGGNLGDAFGNIVITFDVDRMLELNDLMYVEYTEEFEEEFPDIYDLVRGNTEVDNIKDAACECEMYSTRPIRFTPDAIKSIEIRLGDLKPTMFEDKVMDASTSLVVDKKDPNKWDKIVERIKKDIKLEVPSEYHSKITIDVPNWTVVD